MIETLTGFIESVGYLGIAVLMFLEIPLPIIQSEIVMTFSGFATEAQTAQLELVPVILAGVTGSQVGSMALYGLCRKLPEEKVRAFVADHGTWLGFTRENLKDGEDRFRRHGAVAVLIGRLLPGLRAFIAVPAGLVKMPAWKFFVFNLVGTAFWVTVLALLGQWLGSRYQLVDQYSSYITYAFLGVVVALVAYRVVKVRRARATA